MSITLVSAQHHDTHAANNAYHPKGFAMSNLGYVQHLTRLDRIQDVKALTYKQWIMLVLDIVKAETFNKNGVSV